MKAIDYYGKYHDRLLNPETGLVAARELALEMLSEAHRLIKDRRVSTDSGVVAVVKESCEKYEALCRMFQKRDGISPLIPGALKRVWTNVVPGLAEYLEVR